MEAKNLLKGEDTNYLSLSLYIYIYQQILGVACSAGGKSKTIFSQVVVFSWWFTIYHDRIRRKSPQANPKISYLNISHHLSSSKNTGLLEPIRGFIHPACFLKKHEKYT